jgi:hypothetical protein
MQLDVDKADLHHVRAVSRPSRPLDGGEARIRIDRFGLSANNITYAVYGELMRYWACFPGPGGGDTGETADAADGVDWGRVPVWGFGDIVESRDSGLAEGRRVYGYFPLADELVVQPGRHDDQGFSDVSPGRDAVPSVYARYGYVDVDPIYSVEREAQQMLLWPLFVTSFVVDDFLGDHGLFGAGTVVVSSASAKTAIGAAFLLAARDGVEVVGLTSAANLEFVRSLGCYASVLAYEAIDDLPLDDACYVDVAGRRDITHAVHTRLGNHLRYSMVVGDTHWDNTSTGDGAPPGPRPEFLFAPDQIAKRRTDWGRAGFESAVAAAWSRFVPWTDGWLILRHRTGPAEVEAAYRDLLDGRVDPRTGDICTLTDGGPGTRAAAGSADR